MMRGWPLCPLSHRGSRLRSGFLISRADSSDGWELLEACGCGLASSRSAAPGAVSRVCCGCGPRGGGVESVGADSAAGSDRLRLPSCSGKWDWRRVARKRSF